MYEIIGGILFVAFSSLVLTGGPKNINKSAEELTVYEFERNKSLLIAMFCPAIGIFIIIRTLVKRDVSYDASPVYTALLLGAGAIVYGMYRWIKLFRSK